MQWLGNYLDKFGFEEGAGGSFDQDTSNAANSDTPPSHAYESSTGVAVAFTENGDGEVYSVNWTSNTPVSLIWVQAGNDTDEPEYHTPPSTSGIVSVPVNENSLGHLTFCLRPQVEVIKAFTDADGTFPTAQPDPIPAHLVEVFDGAVATGDPVASDFPGATDEDRFGIIESLQYTVVEDAIDGYGEVACAGEVTSEFGATSSGTGTFTAPETGTAVVHVVCNAPTPTDPPEAPQFTVSAACDDETDSPTVTVTVTSNPDGKRIHVAITGEDPVTITATTVFGGDAFAVLTASYGETEKEATFRDDCGPAEFLESTGSFTTASQCETNLPALTYDAKISETADDPVGDVTLTVSDASGDLGQATFSASEAGSVVLPTDLEGATVTVGWDFDDTTVEQQLASRCGAVLGAVDAADDDAADGDVAGRIGSEQLPNTGSEHVLLLLVGGGMLALGGLLLRLSDRRRGVIG